MANEQGKQAQNASFDAGKQTTNTNREQNSPIPQNSQNQSEPADLSVESAKETARGFYDQAKETVSHAYGAATKRAAEVIDEQKGTVADGLTTVADSIKQVGENLGGTEESNKFTETAAKYTNSLADQIQNVSGYFERKDVREMMRDVESFARKYPAYFIGGAFALGFLAARFLKSSNPKQLTNGAGETFNSERSSEPEAKPASNPS